MRRTSVLLLTFSWLVLHGVPAEADLAEIKEIGTLRVLVSADELPHMFSFEATGLPGLEREMIEGFAYTQGLKLEVVKVARFEDIIPALEQGRGDLITGIINTSSRRRRIDFTVQTLAVRHLAVNRAPAPTIDSLAQLRQARVCTVMGSSWTDAALEAGVPPHNLVQVERAQMLLGDLRIGAVEAAVMSVTDFAQAQRDDPALQAGLFIGDRLSAAWGVRKRDRDLRRALDRFIKGLLRSPSWGRIVLKYFSEDALDLMTRARR